MTEKDISNQTKRTPKAAKTVKMGLTETIPKELVGSSNPVTVSLTDWWWGGENICVCVLEATREGEIVSEVEGDC